MRILEVAPFASPIDERREQLGGAQVLIADIARGLASRGHAVTLAAANGSQVEGAALADLDIDSARMRRADLGPTDAPRTDDIAQREAFARVREWLEAHTAEIDVAHAHAYDAPAFAALSRAPRPVVHTLHLPPLDAGVVEAARAAKGATLSTVSEANARAWRKAGVPVGHVIPNGVDLSRIPPGTDRGDHLIYAGRISPEKGVATAIDVAARTGRGLVLVGGVYDERYFAKAVAPRVRRVERLDRTVRGAVYLGARPREEVYRLMGSAAVTLMPVEWDEPFGLVAVESLAAGTPVVAYRRGGLVEIIDDICGELVEPGDVEGLARAVGRAAGKDPAECRRRAQRFGVEAMISAYEAMLAALAHGERRS
ncbi:MAG TPA: glycosyltransferase [Candidatus Limnocylindria bacterium]|nr:glycosyltransferase [Candidatus Limnocylindria bacterium]